MSGFVNSKLKLLSKNFIGDCSSLFAVNLILKRKYKFWKAVFFILLFSFVGFTIFKILLKSSSGYIAKVKIDTVITTDDEIFEALKKIKEDDKIRAVIFQINSPGGTITGSELLYHSIKAISAKKPTATLVQDVAASGAYMASIATNYIVAQNTSMVGSIGVIMDYWNLEEVTKKLGLKKKTIKTTEFKAAPSIYSENSPEVDKYLRDLLEDGYGYFVYLVKQERAAKITNLNEVISGKVFSGRQALNLGLIDKIGNVDDVITFFEKIKKIQNASKLEIKDYQLKEEQEKRGFVNFMANLIFNVFGYFGFNLQSAENNSLNNKISISAI